MFILLLPNKVLMNWWDIYHIILLLGALQGIILGINLWRGDYPRQKANRWLAALLFFFAYRGLFVRLLLKGHIFETPRKGRDNRPRFLKRGVNTL